VASSIDLNIERHFYKNVKPFNLNTCLP